MRDKQTFLPFDEALDAHNFEGIVIFPEYVAGNLPETYFGVCRDTPSTALSLDLLTPWYSERLRGLSPLSQQIILSLVSLNKDHPVGSPISRANLVQSLEKYSSHSVLGTLRRLVEQKVLRVVNRDDAAAMGYDVENLNKRASFYALEDSPFEEWMRSGRCLSRRHRVERGSRQDFSQVRPMAAFVPA